MAYAFGEHMLDFKRRELRRRGELIDVEPQVFDLLTYLIRHRDRVVSKDDLLDGVWGGRIVSDSALTARMSALRRALGHASPDRLHAPARLTGPLRSPAGRRQFLRGRYEGGHVSQVGGPGSHLVAHLARANCLVVVPEDVTELPAGAEVDVVLIEGALQ